jgi:hypothetical protein
VEHFKKVKLQKQGLYCKLLEFQQVTMQQLSGCKRAVQNQKAVQPSADPHRVSPCRLALFGV